MSEPKMKPSFSYTLNLFADYHQLYLQDEQADTDTPEDWGEQLTTQMIAVDQVIVGIGTARNMTVPVRVDLLATRPDDDFDGWDQVAEASLEVPSGQVVIAGCTDYFPEAKRLPVPPGSYRVRVYYGGLNTLSEDGLDGEDHYQVVLWPEKYRSPEVLKKWSSL
jgi:hypothetical protein